MSFQGSTTPATGVVTETHAGSEGADTGAIEAGEAQEGQIDGGEGEVVDDGDDGAEQVQEPDFAEIEYEGEKHKVPAKLREAFLRNADYTQKTQALSEQRRAHEAQVQAFRTASVEIIQDLAKYQAVNDRLKQYEAYTPDQWRAAMAQDPGNTQIALAELTQLRAEAGSLAQQIQAKENQRASEAQREYAKRIEEGRAVLAKEIPNWSPDYGAQLSNYAASKYGFTTQELSQVTDPRIIKVLHDAFQSNQKVKQAATVKNIVAQQQFKPAPQAKGNGAGTQPKDPAKMTNAQYREWRAKQDF